MIILFAKANNKLPTVMKLNIIGKVRFLNLLTRIPKITPERIPLRAKIVNRFLAISG